MEFDISQNISLNNGTIKVDTCSLPNGSPLKCVEKIFDEECFPKISGILTKFSQHIKYLGPQILLVDNIQSAVYMEYIDGVTLQNFLSELSIENEHDREENPRYMTRFSHASMSRFDEFCRLAPAARR